MIPELQIVSEANFPKRIVAKDLIPERLESLRDSVIDFCKRSRSFTQPMNLWEYVIRILKGQEQADLWWMIKEDGIESFLVMKVYPDFDGQWTAYTMFGYSKSNGGKDQYKTILDDYKRKGVSRFQFLTRRNPKVFKRWLGLEWQSVGTLFECKGDLHGRI